ncbi:NAD(P) transhydrogenase subunit alpha [Rickettsiales bacterium Ac37b]|nr:NAD(P) transhydrogenase subunit alpha [Rickettsiales bacterium Ac37b]
MDKKSILVLYDDAQKLNEQIVALAEKVKLLADNTNHLPNNELYIFAITIFILTCFIGYQIVYRARPALYQVLIVMSSTMSGIAIMSVFSIVRETQLNFSTLFSFFMMVVLSATIVAGLIITYRMLKIFSKKHDL